jgi:hypothetical protein
VLSSTPLLRRRRNSFPILTSIFRNCSMSRDGRRLRSLCRSRRLTSRRRMSDHAGHAMRLPPSCWSC